MPKIVRTAVLSAALAATALTALPADAGDRFRHDRDYPSAEWRGNDAEAMAASVFGAAVAAIIAGSAASAQEAAPAGLNPYRHPRPRPDRDYFPTKSGRFGHGSHFRLTPRDWASRQSEWWCDHADRCFDPETGAHLDMHARWRAGIPQ